MSLKERDLDDEIKEAQRQAVEFEKTAHLDEKEIEVIKREHEDKTRKIKLRSDVQQALKVVEARRVLYRVLELCGPYQLSFDADSARRTDFNEGKRAIGLQLLSMILDADSGAYVQMINERQSDLKTEEERKRKENLNK
jgi:hypothetical protein